MVDTDMAQPRRRFGNALLVLAGLASGAWTPLSAAQGTGISIPIEPPILQLGVRTSATYSDNILLAPSGQEESDWLIEASPRVTARSNSPRANYYLFYEMRNFLRVDSGDSEVARHALNATGSFALVEDRLWLDLAGYMGTATDSVTGPIAVDPSSSLVNTAKIRRFSVSPWYRDRIGNAASYELRYAVAHTGGDAGFALAEIDHTASASIDGIARGASPWNWRVFGEAQRREFESDVTRDRELAGARIFYRLNPELRVFASAEYERIENVRNADGEDSGYGPGLGFDWAPNQRTRLEASATRRYYGTIADARASYTTLRTTMGFTYSRGIITSSDSSLLFFEPTALTTGPSGSPGANSVIDGLVAGGLVPSVATSLTRGLITDAAMRDRRFMLFWGLRGVRNSLTLSGWESKRRPSTDLSALAAILAPGGGTGTLFSEEFTEHGLGLTFQHRLDARATIDVVLDQRQTKSADQNFKTRLTTFWIAYMTQLTSRTSAFAGVRAVRQSGEGGPIDYDENAAVLGLDFRFR